MPIDPLAPGKLFVQMLEARRARDADRANLLTQLSARSTEHAADIAQQEAQRKTMMDQFREAATAREKEFGATTEQTKRHQTFIEQQALEGMFTRGEAEPAMFRMTPEGLPSDVTTGTPIPPAQLSVSPSGVVIKRITPEERHQKELRWAKESLRASQEVREEAAKRATELYGPDLGASVLAGFNASTNEWDYVINIGKGLYTDPAERNQFYAKMYEIGRATAPNPAALQGALKIKDEMHRDEGARRGAALGDTIITRLKGAKTPKEWQDFTNDAAVYQQAFNEELVKGLSNKTIPPFIMVAGRPEGSEDHIRAYFETQLKNVPRNVQPRAPSMAEQIQELQKLAPATASKGLK